MQLDLRTAEPVGKRTILDAVGIDPSVNRARLPFRSVNRREDPAYQAGLQRHHLLPRQLLGQRAFAALFAALGAGRLGIDDFRRNGLLLPADDAMALRTRMPLHRGPHPAYSALVAERVGQVELGWSQARRRAPDLALDEAAMRLTLLQSALRRRLLTAKHRALLLNRRDPLASAPDFTDLDALADALWGGTEPAGPA
jgi:hypothetical protein